MGAVVLSPFVSPGTQSDVPYNHYSLLRTIEDLFALESAVPPAKPIPVEWLGRCEPGRPIQLCQVGKRRVAISATPQSLGLPPADGVVSGAASVRIFDDPPAYDQRLLVAGCDPAISLLAQYLLRAEGVELVAAPCSSRKALER